MGTLIDVGEGRARVCTAGPRDGIMVLRTYVVISIMSNGIYYVLKILSLASCLPC